MSSALADVARGPERVKLKNPFVLNPVARKRILETVID
jgi:hypothetical protein